MKLNKKTPTFLLLAALALPGAGRSQEIMWSVQRDRGWIGIELDYSTTIVGGAESTVAFILDVVEDSPAQAAGIQAGDTITHLDGKPVTQRAFQNLPRTLKPGDLVEMTLLRNGRAREVTVEAGSWPTAEGIIIAPRLDEAVIHLDTIQQAILAELNEMRLHIGNVPLDSAPARLSLSILRKTPVEEEGEVTIHYELLEPTFESFRFFPEEYLFAPDVALPFEALVARSPATDSLRAHHARLRQELNEVRRLERARMDELRRLRPGSEEAVGTDSRVRELRAREARLVDEQEALLERIKKVSEEEVKRRAAQIQAHQEDVWAQADAVRDRNWERFEESERAREAAEAAYTYSRFYEVGRTLVAGAELKSLNAELAPYFGVDGGVLVVEVVEGTPAAEADLRGGDVIVLVGGESVSSLEDLKFGMTYLERPLRIRVIRNREPLDMVLRK
jgi:membrane-associated protease RseP (regulator of RpoE activity)